MSATQQTHAAVAPEDLELAVVAGLQAKLAGNHLVASATHDYPVLKSAPKIDLSKINEQVEAAVPKIRNLLKLLGPVLPAQVPLVVNAVLALYDAVNGAIGDGKVAPAPG